MSTRYLLSNNDLSLNGSVREDNKGKIFYSRVSITVVPFLRFHRHSSSLQGIITLEQVRRENYEEKFT